jgi:hypothetical protein
MRTLLCVLLLSGSSLLAQYDTPADASKPSVKDSKGQVTLQGCVSRSGGDYTLVKQDPPLTYELQGTHKIRLSHYLGQRVEVTGRMGPTMSSSSDALNKTGNAAPETLSVTAIRTITKDCSVREASDK